MTKVAHSYRLVCGMEVHAELKTASKMFCGCKNDPFHAVQPNIHTCPVCLGMPGGIPVPNKKAIEWTIQLGLALNCEINLFSKFDRKHYFYPDLAKGYQISQYDIPFCENGYIDTSEGRIRIRRIHLEEDTGKLLHTTLDGEKVSLVDFNRSGVPLVEIVTEPDIKSATQASEYARLLRQIVRYLDIADAEMQKGGMRLEANISLSPNEELPDYKVEVKNINSFKFLEQAINFEIDRQTNLLINGETPSQETRGWDLNKNETFSQRSKESAEDYRYFPDPDIPPIQLTKARIEDLKSLLPELPTAVIERWYADYGIEKRYSELLVTELETTNQIEQLFTKAQAESITPSDLAKDLVNKNIVLNSNVESALKAFKELHSTETVDDSELDGVIKTIINNNQDAVLKYRNGKTQVLGFLLGLVAQTMKKKLDMNLVREKLVSALTE
jgi:aspartyl-tRNA(Asn)/glutamyl-tRNA(Gln) amidotransferase subunit B